MGASREDLVHYTSKLVLETCVLTITLDISLHAGKCNFKFIKKYPKNSNDNSVSNIYFLILNYLFSFLEFYVSCYNKFGIFNFKIIFYNFIRCQTIKPKNKFKLKVLEMSFAFKANAFFSFRFFSSFF